jgi:hypothetical protein
MTSLRFVEWPQKTRKDTKKGKTMKWKNMNELCDLVRETSFAIHCYHRNGHLEKVYENALVHRLKKQGLRVLAQHPLVVYNEDGTVLGEYSRICS